ncbi:hypothetical protein [Dyadobacter soli]|nr:hypothetical protein [Dyadobacter soli]
MSNPISFHQALFVCYLFEDSAPFSMQISNGFQRPITPGGLVTCSASEPIEMRGHVSTLGGIVHGLLLVSSQNLICNPPGESIVHQSVEQLPLIDLKGAKMRVLIGATNHGASMAMPNGRLTLIDVSIDKSSTCHFQLAAGCNAVLYVIVGRIDLSLFYASWRLVAGNAMSVGSSCQPEVVVITAQEDSRAILVIYQPLHGSHSIPSNSADKSRAQPPMQCDRDDEGSSKAFETRVFVLPI